MKYWLLKTEPSTWSWDDQLKSKITSWDGVRNYQARNNLISMKKKDLCFFYHSVKDKKIVGIVSVVKEFYPDPTDKKKQFVMVDVRAYKKLKKSVYLEQIKNDKRLSHLALIKQSRLSVMPIDYKSWSIIMKLSNTKI
tara:strand:+ start:1359 stop:1772 length:414 start_codon:yes stop_codon:yes gene_type:complete